MLLNGYVGYSTVFHLDTGLQKIGVLGRKMYWSRTRWIPRTRCLVVREFGLTVRTVRRDTSRQISSQHTLFSDL